MEEKKEGDRQRLGQTEKVVMKGHKLALTFSPWHTVMMMNNDEQMIRTDLN